MQAPGEPRCHFESTARPHGKNVLPNKSLDFSFQISKRLEEGHQVKICCMNSNKAFDSINRDLWYSETKAQGMKRRENAWVNGFPLSRTLSVTFWGTRRLPPPCPVVAFGNRCQGSISSYSPTTWQSSYVIHVISSSMTS